MALVLGFSATTFARDQYAHDGSILPKAAQATIAKNFNATVSLVKVDRSFGNIDDYEVILTDGTEISFDRKGNWENVETAKTSAVPEAFIPSSVKEYLAGKHPGLRVISIDKDRSGYEVELSNGLDIKFNKSGKFMRYDN